MIERSLRHGVQPPVRRRLRRVVAGCAAAVSLLLATGCTSGERSAETPAAAPGGAFPVTLESALGPTTISHAPQRVITLGWGSTEVALALGVTPVAVPNMKSDSGTDDPVLPWVRDKLGSATPEVFEATSKSMPYEKIAALRPDVILAVQSGVTADQFAKLSAIAPTVGYPGKPWQTGWQDQTRLVGKALGKEKEAAALVDNTNAQLAQARSEHPEFAGKTAAVFSAIKPDGLNVYLATDPRIELLQTLGFTPLPELAQLRQQTDPSKFAADVSWENIPRYNPDVLLSWYLQPALQTSVEANPIFRSLAAVKANSYVALTDPPMVYAISAPNVLNIPWLVTHALPKLSTAAHGTR
ncbi:iron-siderophore ABC transporter substrate-binding protein [Nocardia sp. NPDC051570]|uniref:iron-siderophore ABC transporter substrate-binding protein n=1 Tax=Nocardia sp. NPDC051570 TaxID=3364324 RepID=UPI0037BCD97D